MTDEARDSAEYRAAKAVDNGERVSLLRSELAESSTNARSAAFGYYIGTAVVSLVPAFLWALALPFYFGGDSSSDSGEAGISIALAAALTLVWFLIAGLTGVGLSSITGKSTAHHIGLAVLLAALTLFVAYVAYVAYVALALYADVWSQPPSPPPMG